MSESTGTALGFIKSLNLDPFSLLMTGYDHLCDALAVIYGKILLRQIYQDDAYLTTVIGIDGSGSIQYGYTLLYGQTAAGADLSLESGGK
jgi:hypothetical protein